MLSVSDDVASGNGGGSLQLWRISDLIHRPEHEVLQELQQHARWVVSGKGGSTQVKKESDDQTAPDGVKIEAQSEDVEEGDAPNGET